VGDNSDDWKNILTSVSTGDTGYADLTENTATIPEDTTLTAQMAKDVLSTYLLSTKTGQPFTSDTADQIAQTVLSSPNYAETAGTVYLSSNLHIAGDDKTALSQYKLLINTALINRASELKNTQDPIELTTAAVQSDSEAALAGINPLIHSASGFINDLLQMNVPKSAVTAHLELLNATNDLLSDFQAMRNVLTDPTRSLTTLGQYNTHIANLQKALQDMNSYVQGI
jgi:hypothetical protein